MFKYADDTYIVIPAANVNSRYAELDHVDRWVQNNNLRLNRAKSVEIIFTDRKRKPPEHLPLQIPDFRHITSIKMNYGTFVPKTIHSHGGTFVLGN